MAKRWITKKYYGATNLYLKFWVGAPETTNEVTGIDLEGLELDPVRMPFGEDEEKYRLGKTGISFLYNQQIEDMLTYVENNNFQDSLFYDIVIEYDNDVWGLDWRGMVDWENIKRRGWYKSNSNLIYSEMKMDVKDCIWYFKKNDVTVDDIITNYHSYKGNNSNLVSFWEVIDGMAQEISLEWNIDSTNIRGDGYAYLCDVLPEFEGITRWEETNVLSFVNLILRYHCAYMITEGGMINIISRVRSSDQYSDLQVLSLKKINSETEKIKYHSFTTLHPYLGNFNSNQAFSGTKMLFADSLLYNTNTYGEDIERNWKEKIPFVGDADVDYSIYYDYTLSINQISLYDSNNFSILKDEDYFSNTQDFYELTVTKKSNKTKTWNEDSGLDKFNLYGDVTVTVSGIEASSDNTPELCADYTPVFLAETNGREVIDFNIDLFENTSGLESGNTTGHGFALFDNNGNEIIGVALSNPEWNIKDSNGWEQVYAGDGTEHHIDVTIDFDWSAGKADITIKDESSGTTNTYSGRPLINTTNVEEIRLKNFDGSIWNSGACYADWNQIKMTYPQPNFTDVSIQKGDYAIFQDTDGNDIIGGIVEITQDYITVVISENDIDDAVEVELSHHKGDNFRVENILNLTRAVDDYNMYYGNDVFEFEINNILWAYKEILFDNKEYKPRYAEVDYTADKTVVKAHEVT